MTRAMLKKSSKLIIEPRRLIIEPPLPRKVRVMFKLFALVSYLCRCQFRLQFEFQFRSPSRFGFGMGARLRFDSDVGLDLDSGFGVS